MHVPGAKCASVRRISASTGDRPKQPCLWGSKGAATGNGTGGRSRYGGKLQPNRSWKRGQDGQQGTVKATGRTRARVTKDQAGPTCVHTEPGRPRPLKGG
eukprot:7127399-Pyramimonas_sp.AAC.1